ncbi:MAG: hypothetical protein LBS60_06820 [Deltaproteobacteria bacterium]|jgi:hypothetical protein|nr:hypothetical protein [Deltaproteobacteria bacterium]
MKPSSITLTLSAQDQRLDDRLDCYGHFDLKDTVCSDLCAIRLNCAISRSLNLNCQLIEDKPHPELGLGWRDFV